MNTVDVGAVLDDAHWSRYQKLLVFATAMTIILDGLDNQLLGAAMPALMREWSLPRPAFVPVQTSGLIGMMVGGAIGGIIGDRFGRRIALLGSVVSFGVLTILVSFSGGVAMLTVLRFFVGLGLGGAMPNAAALSSEYVPRRQRPFAVTLTIVCIPLGGSLAGFIGGQILPRFGWRALFLIGGILPLVMAAVLLKLLPESPRYLARLPERWPELRVLLRRLGHQVPDDASFVDASEKAVMRVSARELLVPEYRRDTLALCASFFFCLLSVYIGVTWVPSLLANAGFDVGTASYGLTAFNLGGVVGAILGAIVIMRLGSRLTMLVMAAGASRGRGRAGVHADWPAVGGRGPRHAGVDRRSDQRRSDDDVCARRARLSHGRPRHRCRHGGGLRPYWRRAQSIRRIVGARIGRFVAVFRPDGRDDGDGIRRAVCDPSAHSGRNNGSRCSIAGAATSRALN